MNWFTKYNTSNQTSSNSFGRTRYSANPTGTDLWNTCNVKTFQFAGDGALLPYANITVQWIQVGNEHLNAWPQDYLLTFHLLAQFYANQKKKRSREAINACWSDCDFVSEPICVFIVH
ncbi:hypothetical protein Peur_017018 [Populus x canadensis]